MRGRVIIAWLYLVSLLLVMISYVAACKTGEAKLIPFRTLPNTAQWLISDQPTYLILTQKNWSTYYSTPPPYSNFADCIYIVASRGVKPNPGYTIRIVKISQLKKEVTIKLELREPDPKKVYPQILVHPITVAEVAKSDLKELNLLTFIFVNEKGQEIATFKAQV